LPLAKPIKPVCDLSVEPPAGHARQLEGTGAPKFAEWMREQKRVLLTDTTMRDAHQSLFATRMRTHDITEHRAALRAACCRICSRWNAGAARPSTWRCAS
jgi:pyruvate carboxylase